MAYEVEWKQRNYNDDLSKIISTTVQISTRKPQRILTVTLDSDVTSKNDEELVALSLEQFYKETYLDRAEKEAISNLRQEIDKINTESFAKLKEDNNALLSKAVADLTLLITESINDITETLSVEEEEENDNKESKEDI